MSQNVLDSICWLASTKPRVTMIFKAAKIMIDRNVNNYIYKYLYIYLYILKFPRKNNVYLNDYKLMIFKMKKKILKVQNTIMKILF